MANYEIEIKSLIGDKAKADELVAKMQSDPSFCSHGKHKQLNHYFTKGDLITLRTNLGDHINSDKSQEFNILMTRIKDFSVRTAQRDGKVSLIIKATIDDMSSSNGIARHEFEAEIDLSLQELDQIVLNSGFEYQAKWSREREEYQYKGLNVCVDKNAGYGYLAEFESIIDDVEKAEDAKNLIRNAMKELNAEELRQDRLERMFEYYNQNWQDYYGTEKIFKIE